MTYDRHARPTPYDSMADVVLCLAFAKLSSEQVEVIRDAPVTASFTAWA